MDKKIAMEAGFAEGTELFGKPSEHDPCHAMCVIGQNLSSVMAETISETKEVKGCVRIGGEAGDEYLPSGSPMSSLTTSCFTMWAMFDVRFGSSRETMGSCILRIAPEFDCPTWLVDTIGGMRRSRMDFHMHCGSEGEGVPLREVGTQEVVSCMVPAGHAGHEGPIWFVRVLEPPYDPCPRHIVFNAPCVISGCSENDFVDCLDREPGRMEQKKPPGMEDAHFHLMKCGPEPNHWNEYIFCAFSNCLEEAIFLTGIPDIREPSPMHRPVDRSELFGIDGRRRCRPTVRQTAHDMLTGFPWFH